MKKILKIFVFGVCYAVFIYIVFIAEMLWQFLQAGTEISMESDFFSGFWYNVIYYGLPIMAFVIPFVLAMWKRLKWKKTIKCAAITLLAYALIVCAISISLAGYFENFTSTKWEAYPNQRYIMYDDLKETYGLIGMTIDEVEELLGKPTTDGENTVYGGPYALEYFSGESTFGYWILNITYDENGIVIRVHMSNT